uniref:Uncharacterized protein n=1 Tax=Aegilops tauschii subsp. strangulata TaxID=200361 RepID=A0A453D5Z7_AEGTS
ETSKALHFSSASRCRRSEPNMDAGQFVIPILGIVGAAAATFYAVSFMEIREVCLVPLIPPCIRTHNFSPLIVNSRRWCRNHWRTWTTSTRSTRRAAGGSAGRGGGPAAKPRSEMIDGYTISLRSKEDMRGLCVDVLHFPSFCERLDA